MKTINKIMGMLLLLLLTACGGKAKDAPRLTDAGKDTVANVNVADSDVIVCAALMKFLNGNESAVKFSDAAKEDLVESSWPEVFCSVEKSLDTPSAFKDLKVYAVGPGQYKYSCVCPDHGDKFVDFCTVHAVVDEKGTVVIEHVTWDEEKSLAEQLDNATWKDTEYGFQVPDFMTALPQVFVDEIPAAVVTWVDSDLCLACWPLLGAWAVDYYPEKGSFLTEDVKVQTITYQNSTGYVFSGMTNDDRVWYMKKCLIEDGDITHAKALVLLYDRSQQDDVKRLIDMVMKWK